MDEIAARMLRASDANSPGLNRLCWEQKSENWQNFEQNFITDRMVQPAGLRHAYRWRDAAFLIWQRNWPKEFFFGWIFSAQAGKVRCSEEKSTKRRQILLQSPVLLQSLDWVPTPLSTLVCSCSSYMLHSCSDSIIACTRNTLGNGCILSSSFSLNLTSYKVS